MITANGAGGTATANARVTVTAAMQCDCAHVQHARRNRELFEQNVRGRILRFQQG